MKQIIFAVAILITTCVQAQSDKFASAIGQNVEAMKAAQSPDDFKAVAAAFERIGDAEKTQWLPYYYAGLNLTSLGWRDEKLDKDANSAKVLELCDKALALTTDANDKAEILSIRNMAYTQQMLVDAQSRWMTYGQQAGNALQEAMKLNPNNPRLYYLQGMSLFGTPEQFGGGKEKAKAQFEKAIELYGKEEAKPLYPDWGKQQTEDMIKQCGE